MNSAHILACPPRSLVLAVLILTSFNTASSIRRQTPNRSDNAEVREEIGAIIRERSIGIVNLVNGVRVETKIPPSPEAVKAIKRYGDDAVPVLTDYSRSKNLREREAAIEFLGLLGGRRIISPLERVINFDSKPHLRILALRWITNSPPELSLPIIREAAKKDSNQRVRDAAQDILSRH